MLFQLDHRIIFPDPSLADEDGLLAIGGDLSVERLMLAYQNGIFPWFSEDEPILWHSPHRRFVLLPDEVHVSHSMWQRINSQNYEVRFNTAFEQVITHCATIKRPGQHGTWINNDMIKAYTALRKKGIAQSVEVWHNETLVGGLYGVALSKVFCGESMFSLQPDTSKLALIALCKLGKYQLIDCQVYTQHLKSMGAKFISRAEFMAYLKS